ncbi:hypothetical protein BaRGS_00033337 [Batillaria attramentaria]|uniref:Uncharacterized protein n=1 Tax=Batillaria attramentaria TaxID=370345 RepID=A0ABD0JK38_9CAEN
MEIARETAQYEIRFLYRMTSTERLLAKVILGAAEQHARKTCDLEVWLTKLAPYTYHGLSGSPIRTDQSHLLPPSVAFTYFSQARA